MPDASAPPSGAAAARPCGAAGTADTGADGLRQAFEQALSLLQRRRSGPEEREPGAEPAAALPAPPGAARPEGAPAEGLAAAAGASGTRLSPEDIAGTLQTLRAPATPEGPQRWEFHFGPATLPLQSLTLQSLPGGALQLQLLGSAARPARERELALQRLEPLRQRLVALGQSVAELQWSEASDDPADPR